MPKRHTVPVQRKYLVGFDVVDAEGIARHRGEMEFTACDDHLEYPIRCVLGLIGQPAACPRQYQFHAVATGLWEKADGGRRALELPEAIVSQQASSLTHRDALRSIIGLVCSCEDPSQCSV
jgi:hypothetical protein